MIRLTFPGKPIPKKRHRNTKKGRIYWTQGKQQDDIRWQIKSQYNGKPIKGAVALNMTFYMYIPKSEPKYKQEMMHEGRIWHIKKPDKDNLEKFYLDCMNRIVYEDDCQVVITTSKKCYDKDPRTEIVVEELK